MPGISFVRGPSASELSATTALRDVCFRDDYAADVHADADRGFLASTGYPEYPVRTVETSEAVFALEGHLYDADDERRHLRSVGSALLDERIAEVGAWLGERDGDFLLAAYEKATGTLRAVNDTFARLPTYYATAGDDVVLSRELKFVRNFAAHCGEPLELDSMAAAQTLLFGYQLGDRTLYDSVWSVPPGSYVRVGDEVEVHRLYRHDFEGHAHADRSVAENAAALASLFEDVCGNRNVEGLPNVLSLSGGLDSRAAGAGYRAAGVDFTAATFEKPDGANETDVRLAERIADALDAEWERYDVEETAARRSELLETKQGMNFLAMSFLLDFLEQLWARHGQFVYVTGDGGDKALPDMTPPRNFDSRGDLAEYIVDAHSIFDSDEAAAIAGIEREALVRAVEDRLDSYPESSFDAQYVHFLVRERGVNWLNHGEDRNRYYCWSVSPFYSRPFFEYAMNVPADQKRRSELYAAFLDELDPAMCDIENANYGASVTSLRHKAKQFGVSLVSRYPALKQAVAALLKNGTEDGLTRLLTAQFRRADETALADEQVAEVLRDDESYDGHELYNLLTLLSASNREADPMVRDEQAPSLVSDGSGVRQD